MNTLTEQQILKELQELDPFSQQELLDFLAFLRYRQQPETKPFATIEHGSLAKPFPLTHVEDGIGYQGPRKSLAEME